LTWKTAEVSVPTLLITGTTGVGKSTVAAEINDVLAALKVPNAAVDLDALVWQWPSTSAWNNVERLLERMPPGPSRDWHLHRTVELEAVLGRLAHEDFTVGNGNRSVREVALDVLVRAGWVPTRPSS
jgi:hypothetical protein